ncbi:MAG TPA: hypothetical protein VIK89_13835 [Cytophagaceae bacterium]
MDTKQDGIEPFFPVTFNPSRRDGFLCSPEHGKLWSFEALETELVPQNNLPFAGGRKHLPKSGFCMDCKMDL